MEFNHIGIFVKSIKYGINELSKVVDVKKKAE